MRINILERAGIDPEIVAEAGLELMLGGRTRRQAARELAELLDARLDFTQIIKGPVGDVIEAIDRPLLRALIILLLPKKAE